MAKWTPSLLTGTLLITLLPTTSAADLAIGTWQTAGSQLWRTVYPLHTSGIDGASELDYPYSGTYLTASYENKTSPNHALFIESGLLTSPVTHIGSDSDWDTSQSNALSYYGQFKTTNKSYFLTVDAKHHISDHTSTFYGYTYHHYHYSMTDGLYSISNYLPVNQALLNLNSYYNMIYQGPHIGVIHEIPITQTLSAIGSFSYAPWLLTQGHGWWNLRNLSFDHEGTAQMIDGMIGIRYATTPQNTTLTLGYRYQSFKLATGHEYLTSSASWHTATNTAKGYFFTGEKRF